LEVPVISNIRIQNFKSLKETNLRLGLRNLLVGPNMAGKSNLIDVFKFLARMVMPSPGSYGLPNAFQVFGGFSEIQWKGDNDNLFKLELEGYFPSADRKTSQTDWKYSIEILGDPRGWPRVQEESLLMAGPQEKFRPIDKVNGRRVLKNANGTTISEVPDSDRSALEFEIPDWEGNRIRSLFGLTRFYQLIPALMKGPNQTAAADFLSEEGANFPAWLLTLQTKHAEAFGRMINVMKDAFPSLESVFSLPTQQATVFVASREKFLKRPIPSMQMSDGELAFLALLSLILTPPELGAPLYCIEEPENHLHPRLLEILVEVQKQVQNESDAGCRSQVLITTHSPSLVDMIDLEDLIVFTKRDGVTQCTRPSDKSHLRDILANEETGLGSLFYSGALEGV
jgi:predicted ATPase